MTLIDECCLLICNEWLLYGFCKVSGLTLHLISSFATYSITDLDYCMYSETIFEQYFNVMRISY